MGYENKRRTFVLEFEGDREGLEVHMRSLPLGRFVELTKMMTEEQDDQAVIEPVLNLFVDSLKKWNLEEDGVPVPSTREGVFAQDIDFVMEVINAWVQGMSGVSGDLGKGSTSGGTSRAPSLPMETL